QQVATNSGCATVAVHLGSPIVADNCGTATVSHNATASFPLGSTTVTWTALDLAGNTSSCTQQITVLDLSPPTLLCPPPLDVAANAACGATGVDLGVPAAEDNCDLVSLLHDAPAIFPLGTTTVTWTATDAQCNTSSCLQTVTVADQLPPVNACPPDMLAQANNGCTATRVDLGNAPANGNFGAVTLSNDAP